MAAPDNAKLQANFKLADGTLINVYASSAEEFESLLTTVQDTASLIQATSASFSGQAPAPRQSATQAASVVMAGIESAPTCRHGNMTLRSGTGAKGPWKGWMCAAPKGAPDKCDTIWVK